MKFLNEDFHRAGFWFLCFAVLASLPWLLILPGMLLSFSMYVAGDRSMSAIGLIQMAALPTLPLVSSYLLGGFLGKEIISNPDLKIWPSRIRGVLVASGALVTFVIINLIDISLHDYSNSVETSAERSMSIVSGITSFMAPVALLIGGWAGGRLKARSEKYTKMSV